MSILLILDCLLAGRRLIERPSEFTGLETARTMYVTPEISDLTTPPFPDTEKGDRLAVLAAWLDAFSEHGEFSVSEDPDNKPPSTMLARVHPTDAEFWSIRVTEPECTAGIRILGAFVAKDEFMALTWEYREFIASFDGEVEAVRDEWRDLFGALRPHSGNNVSDYLTNFVEM